MYSFYPAIQPFAEHYLTVDSPHIIYVEQCGNPDGIPVIFVHGGPGGACSPDHRRYFDPNIYHIILFDQRGCGRSKPCAELHRNDTQALIADMELIREKLGIESWVLFGGSWGSTLSLLYAQAHPQHTLGLILRGIFLGTNRETNWLFEGQGANRIFPEAWEKFLSVLPEKQRHNLLLQYYALLNSEDEQTRMAAAKAWATWEMSCSTLKPNPDNIDRFSEPAPALEIARLECHYMVNNFFIQPDQIMNNIETIQALPSIIVHGRYDIVCAMEGAWRLHKALPNSELNIVTEAGHSGAEPGIIDALVRAAQRMVKRVS